MCMRALFLAAVSFAVPALSAQTPAGSIDVPQGARPILIAKGVGAQIYTCSQTPQGFKWTLKAPDAHLFNAAGKDIGKHFAGPTWQLNDGGEVQGELITSRPSPDPASIAWLLLRTKPGAASGSLASVAFIRRTDTQGGSAPGIGCQGASDAGKSARIDYTATYTFYAAH